MARELLDIELHEISMVDKAATKKDFLFFKQDGVAEFRRYVPVFITKKEERLVAGVVYAPGNKNDTDTQGDYASAETIEKAAHQFMQDVQVFKVNHSGQKASIRVLESYIVPQDLTIAEQEVRKGSWIIKVRVLSDAIWKKVKDGTLTGFSMGGTSHTAKGMSKSYSSDDSALWPSISCREVNTVKSEDGNSEGQSSGEGKWPSISDRADD